MTVSRRNFLRASTMIALAAALPLGLTRIAAGQQQTEGFPIPAAVQNDPLYNYTRATFTPYVNSIFIINSVPLAKITLIEVKETPLVVDRRARRTPAGECFTLTFSGPERTRFQQETYTVEHAALGKFNLFITPTDRPNARQQLYTAVINRRL
jgi:hypothetical protein